MEWNVIKNIMERDFKRTMQSEKEVSYIFNGVFEGAPLTLKIQAASNSDVFQDDGSFKTLWWIDIECENSKFLHLLTSYDYRIDRDYSCGRFYESLEDFEESIFEILKNYRSDLDIVRAMLG